MNASRVRVLIVDDEPLARTHLRSLLEARTDIEVIGECGDGVSAVELIRTLNPALVLLDVQMPELDGFGVVREIGVEGMPPVVFVTAYDQHALAAFEVHAIDYILKPVNRARFQKSIDRAVELARARAAAMHTDFTGTSAATDSQVALGKLLQEMGHPRAGADRLAVRVGEKVLYLRMRDIDWVEAADDVVKLHVGKQVYEHRTTLAQLEQRLPQQFFMRIHRSTIVNIERIREFEPWFQGDWLVVLADGTKLQSGKSFRGKIREMMG